MENDSRILAEVREELVRRKGGWRDICDDLGISYHWMAKVVQGQIPNPRIENVERLHRYLFAERWAA